MLIDWKRVLTSLFAFLLVLIYPKGLLLASANDQIQPQKQWVSFSGGLLNSFAVKQDGTVWVWGKNQSGILGVGDQANYNAPVKNPYLSDIIAVSKGYAIKRDGTVWSWGGNPNLPEGYDDRIHQPKQIPGLDHVTTVAPGSDHSLALKDDGSVWAWGYNMYGQLGTGSDDFRKGSIDPYYPSRVINLDHVIAIGAGSDISIALKNDGTVWTWGQVMGDPSKFTNTPAKVDGLDHIVAISTGMNHMLALKDDGTVWTMGWNMYGQLGDGKGGRSIGDQSLVPVQAVHLSDVISISSGAVFCLALKKDGTVWEWGSLMNADLGQDSVMNAPVQVSGLSRVVSITALNDHAFAVTQDGRAWAWGENKYGELGDGTNSKSLTPVQVQLFPFSDMQDSAFRNDITNLAANRIISGYTDSTFHPNGSITRAEFAALAVRALKLPTDTSITPFVDVDSNDWAAPYIASAAKAGLISGYDAAHFQPENNITREEAAHILQLIGKKYGKLNSFATTEEALKSLSSLSDGTDVSNWAVTSVAEVYKNNIIDVSQGLRPTANATRGEVAHMLNQLLSLLGLI